MGCKSLAPNTSTIVVRVLNTRLCSNDSADASHFLWAWKPYERRASQSLYATVDCNRSKTPATESDPLDIRTLVHSRCCGNGEHGSKDDSRLRRGPRELYQVQYPAPGDSDLASRVQKLLSPLQVRLDEHSGLEHCTWAV